MKHNLKIIVVFGALFLCANVIGALIIEKYLARETVIVKGVPSQAVTWKNLPYDVGRPEFEEKQSFLPVFGLILVATVLVLILMRLKLLRVWKLWFFLSVWFCLLVALNAFMPQVMALVTGFVTTFFKVVKRNLWVHNLSELLVYGGLAAVFVPVFNLMSVSILLVLISVYDAYAVWKSKHMVRLAKFQASARVFAGLLITYGRKKTAVLGGGDIGFPLIFMGVVQKQIGFPALWISLFTTLALVLLLVKGERGKFYPAMPFLTAGCFVGLLFVKLFIVPRV